MFCFCFCLFSSSPPPSPRTTDVYTNEFPRLASASVPANLYYSAYHLIAVSVASFLFGVVAVTCSVYFRRRRRGDGSGGWRLWFRRLPDASVKKCPDASDEGSMQRCEVRQNNYISPLQLNFNSNYHNQNRVNVDLAAASIRRDERRRWVQSPAALDGDGDGGGDTSTVDWNRGTLRRGPAGSSPLLPPPWETAESSRIDSPPSYPGGRMTVREATLKRNTLTRKTGTLLRTKLDYSDMDL